MLLPFQAMTNEAQVNLRAPPEKMAPEAVSVLQREVQRKLGRCLLRLQQYERHMKTLATHVRLAGPTDELIAIQKERAETVSRMTLGQLVKELDGTYLRIDPAAGHIKEPERDEGDGKRIWFSTEMRIELQPEEFQRVLAGLKELVDLRNQLVHHLLDRFDLWDEAGCRAADAQLVESYSKIDQHYAVVREWVFAMGEGHRMMAEFMASPAYADFLIFGINPDGTVDWPGSGIVRNLRAAEAALAKNGWVDLDTAIAHMVKVHPEHTPARYGCNSWRHVLHESREFEVQRELGTALEPGRTRFRSR